MTDLLQWGSLRFPDAGTLWGRSRGGIALYLGRRSALLAAAATVGVGVVGYLAVSNVEYRRLAASDRAAIARTERANADLQDALARLRDQIGANNQALSAAQGRIAALNAETSRQAAVSEEAATSKIDRIAQLTRELHLTEAQRVTLIARLSMAEADLAKGQARQQQAQAGLDQWQKQVQQLTAERDHLRARVSELEQKLAGSPARQASRPLAQAQPAPASRPASVATAAPTVAVAPPAAVARAQPAPAVASAAAPATSGRLAQFERVLASAGVDVSRLFAQYGVHTGEGGPFVPVPRGGKLPVLSGAKLAALDRLVDALPVSAPLASYKIGSPFGVRGDPMNGRHEFHTGLDLLAPYMTPVYATAPGVVTFSGYRDDYGKVVEIDHGNGITTRYAHLHRQTVSVGQHVSAHTQVGFLGSTGRATGPHLHYEVLVNGEPQDPTKFFSLDHLVRVAQR